MWKDFFYFSSIQRAGILILLCLILVIGAIDCLLPFILKSLPIKEDTSFLKEIDVFKKSLASTDSIAAAERLQRYPYYNNAYERRIYVPSDPAADLFPFDPNELDSLGFVSLGLKPYVIANILKFRRKGGLYKDRKSFARVYGISEQQYLTLLPYIQLTKQDHSPIDSTEKKINMHDPALQYQVELNTADTTELMKIKGIGRAYAYAILKYRKQTGGFVRIDQLGEIYGMTPENLESIMPHCIVDRALIKKINVNTASIEKLKAHPYLNFYQAKQIYELRRKKGALSGMDDLNNLSALNDTTLKKIAEYLSFE